MNIDKLSLIPKSPYQLLERDSAQTALLLLLAVIPRVDTRLAEIATVQKGDRELEPESKQALSEEQHGLNEWKKSATILSGILTGIIAGPTSSELTENERGCRIACIENEQGELALHNRHLAKVA